MKTRTLELDHTRADPSGRTVPCTISTDAPCDMGSMVEVLDHTPGAVSLQRMPLPVITSHNLKDIPVGVFENPQLAGGRLRGNIRFGNSVKAAELFQDVKDGVVRSLSVGYSVEEHKPIGTDKTGRPIVRAVKWSPHEVSIVSTPADPGAGFFRSLLRDPMDMNEQYQDQPMNLSRSQRRAAAAASRDVNDAIADERNRCAEITAMARSRGLPDDLRDQMIDEGVSLADARARALEFDQQQRPPVRSLSSSHDLGHGSRDGFGYGQRGFGDIGMSAHEAQDFSICRLIGAQLTNDWRKAGLERSACQAAAKQSGADSEGFVLPRDVMNRGWGGQRATYQASSALSGASTVATNLLADAFIDVLRNKAVVVSAGATLLEGLVGNTDLPRRSLPTATFWVGESLPVTESEGQFDKVSLRPKTLGALSKFSRLMILQGTPAIESLIRADLAAQMALGIDLAALSGSGSSNQPTGISNLSGVAQIVAGTNGGNASFDLVLAMESALNTGNAPMENRAFIMGPKVYSYLSGLKATTGQYLWANGGGVGGGIGAPPAATLHGLPYTVTNQARNNLTKGTSVGILNEMFLGAWSELVIGSWGTLEIVVNPYDSTGFTTGDVVIRSMQTVDIQARHGGSFAYIGDLLTPGY